MKNLFEDDDLEYLLLGLRSADYVVIDTETNGEEIRDGRGYCMGISVAYTLPGFVRDATYIPIRHETNNIGGSTRKRIRDCFNEEVKCAIFHNAKFDLVSLETLGICYGGPFFDTMLMAHMLNENIPSKELDYLSNLFLDKRKKGDATKGWAKAWGWATIPPEVMADYAVQDVLLTDDLYKRFQEAWKKHGYNRPNPNLMAT